MDRPTKQSDVVAVLLHIEKDLSRTDHYKSDALLYREFQDNPIRFTAVSNVERSYFFISFIRRFTGRYSHVRQVLNDEALITFESMPYVMTIKISDRSYKLRSTIAWFLDELSKFADEYERKNVQNSQSDGQVV